MNKGQLIQILKDFPDNYEFLIKTREGLTIFFQEDIYRDRYSYNPYDTNVKTFKNNIALPFDLDKSLLDESINSEKCIVIDISNSGNNYKEIIEEESKIKIENNAYEVNKRRNEIQIKKLNGE